MSLVEDGVDLAQLVNCATCHMLFIIVQLMIVRCNLHIRIISILRTNKITLSAISKYIGTLRVYFLPPLLQQISCITQASSKTFFVSTTFLQTDFVFISLLFLYYCNVIYFKHLKKPVSSSSTFYSFFSVSHWLVTVCVDFLTD